MTSCIRQRLFLEQLDARDTPAVARAIGTLHLISETLPSLQQPAGGFMQWVSGDQSGNKSDGLRGALSATFTLTGPEEALAHAAGAGITLTEEIRWREDDGAIDEDVKISSAAYKWMLPANINAGTLVYTPTGWDARVDDWADGFWEMFDAEFYGWLNKPAHAVNLSTLETHMSEGLDEGGTTVAGYITGTGNVGYGTGSAFANPAIPTVSPGAAGYRVLAFTSQNGQDLVVSAANATGYTLMAASSNALAWDTSTQDTVIPQTTTFTPVYSTGTMAAGQYNGSNRSWVIRSADGSKTFYPTGYSYTGAPVPVAALADGQTTTITGASLQSGSSALWLTFETDGGTIGFLITERLLPVGGTDGTGSTQQQSLAASDDSSLPVFSDASEESVTAATREVSPAGTSNPNTYKFVGLAPEQSELRVYHTGGSAEHPIPLNADRDDAGGGKADPDSTVRVAGEKDDVNGTDDVMWYDTIGHDDGTFGALTDIFVDDLSS